MGTLPGGASGSMKNIYLKVGVYVGSDVRDVIKDCLELSLKINIPVCVVFNGISLMIDDSRNVDDVLSEYSDRIDNTNNGWHG